MKRLAALAFGLVLLAAPALSAEKAKHKPKPVADVPHNEIAPAAAPTLTQVQAVDASGNIVYLSQLPPVAVVSGTDTTFWCDYAPGCGPGISLKRVTAQQIGQFVNSRLGANPPLSTNGSAISLNFDSTLSVVGNQLHVVSGGGGGGFPFTLGSTTIPGSTSVPLVTNLQLTNSVLNGNVAGSPNYTGVPTYASLSTGTAVTCLGLDASNHLIKVACGSGPPPGGHFFAVQGGAAFGVQGGAQFGVQ